MEPSTHYNIAQRTWDGGSQVNCYVMKIPPEQWPERFSVNTVVTSVITLKEQEIYAKDQVSATGVTSRYLCGRLAM